MGQKDIISKSLIEKLAVCLVTRLLKFDIIPESLQLLNTEQHRVEDRRADMVTRVQHKHDQATYLLHIEIQNNNHPQMPLRMLRYYTDIRLNWPNEPVKQYLIYTGKENLSMPAGLEEMNYTYQVIDMRTINCTLLLQEDTPDALVLAILCDFKDRAKDEVVTYIVKRLYQITQNDAPKFRRYLHMLEVLSDNRNLRETIKETEKMLTDFNVKRLPSYELGWEQGIQDGIQQRKEQEQRNQLTIASELIGELPDQRIAELFNLPLTIVQTLHTEKP